VRRLNRLRETTKRPGYCDGRGKQSVRQARCSLRGLVLSPLNHPGMLLDELRKKKMSPLTLHLHLHHLWSQKPLAVRHADA
jgi:hypothetical protein